MGCSQSETEIAIEVLRQVCNTFQNCEQFQRSFSDIQKKIKVIISFALYSLKNSVADPDLVETASLDLTFFLPDSDSSFYRVKPSVWIRFQCHTIIICLKISV